MPPGASGATARVLTRVSWQGGTRRPGRGPGLCDLFARHGQARGGRGLDKAVHDGLGEPARRGLQGAHLGQYLARRGPGAGVLSQAAADQRAQRAGHVVQVRWVVDQPVHERGVRSGAERPGPGRGEGKHGTQAENVAGRADVRAQDLLG